MHSICQVFVHLVFQIIYLGAEIGLQMQMPELDFIKIYANTVQYLDTIEQMR
jgi:hypothetical protein